MMGELELEGWTRWGILYSRCCYDPGLTMPLNKTYILILERSTGLMLLKTLTSSQLLGEAA